MKNEIKFVRGKLVYNGEKTDNKVLVIAGVVYLVVVLLILILL